MSDPTIVTNNQPRHILYWYELTDKERDEFDYIDTAEQQEWATFFRYKGDVYHLQDIMTCERIEQFRSKGWDGYAGDSYFSGILVKYIYNIDDDHVIVGRYYC